MIVYIVQNGFYREIEEVHDTEQAAWDAIAEKVAEVVAQYPDWPKFEELEANEWHVEAWEVKA